MTEVGEQAFAFQYGRNRRLGLAKAWDLVERVAAKQS